MCVDNELAATLPAANTLPQTVTARQPNLFVTPPTSGPERTPNYITHWHSEECKLTPTFTFDLLTSNDCKITFNTAAIWTTVVAAVATLHLLTL